MAAGAWVVYTSAVDQVGLGAIDLATNAFVVALVSNSYVPAPNTDATWSNVSADELPTGGGYTAGGLLLVGQSWSQNAGTLTFTAASPTWVSFTATLRYGVIVRRAGAALAPTDQLLCYSDLGGGAPVTGQGGPLTITINAAGIFAATHTP